MPITVSQMATNSVTVAFDYAGETVNVTYAPGNINEKVFAGIASLAEANSFDLSKVDTTNMSEISADLSAVLSAVNDTLVAVVSKWDVLNDDGTMFPLDVKRLSELPILFRAEVLTKVFENFAPNATGATAIPPSAQPSNTSTALATKPL